MGNINLINAASTLLIPYTLLYIIFFIAGSNKDESCNRHCRRGGDEPEQLLKQRLPLLRSVAEQDFGSVCHSH